MNIKIITIQNITAEIKQGPKYNVKIKFKSSLVQIRSPSNV
jgi:hypothetical protein